MVAAADQPDRRAGRARRHSCGRPRRAVAIRRRPPTAAGRAARRARSGDVAGADDHAAAVGAPCAGRAVASGQRRGAAGGAATAARRRRRQPLLRVAVDGQLVVAKNDAVPLSPASNLKILIAAVALDVLGPGFTYSTKVVGAARRRRCRRRRSVPRRWRRPGAGQSMVERQQPEVAAVQRDVVRGARRRDPAARVSPGHGQRGRRRLALRRRVLRADVGRRRSRHAGRADRRAAGQRLVADAAQAPPTIRRSARPRCCATCSSDRGIDVGDASTGVAPPAAATIAEVQSQPLPAILAEMLTTSDNNTAEMVLKEIGFQGKGSRQPDGRVAGRHGDADGLGRADRWRQRSSTAPVCRTPPS